MASNQPASAQGQRPAHRDMMFCHECADEWYRDEKGLTCPECGSDFTEIIEEVNDPRDSAMFANDESDQDDSMPGLEEHTQNPHHNPWQNDDPEEGDISNVQFTQTAPGRYNVQATITRSVSPQQFRAAGGMAPASIGGFVSMLTGLAGTALGAQGQQRAQQGQGEGLFSGVNRGQAQSPSQDQSAFQEAQGQNAGGPPPQFRTTRFQYHGGARLFPRDANNPEPRMEPTDDITNVVTGLMAALGAPPGSIHTQAHPGGGFEARFGGGNGPEEAGMPPTHPLLSLFSSLGMMGGSGQMGDFVYSQEGLDRIITQLMEQTATSNAPGPATEQDIESLPRKTVDEEMLGTEHRAECSICMDEVNIGEEVTVLPCKHWFHHPCVSAWLQEHDTCPHCRKGIAKDHGADNNAQAAGAQSSQAQTSGSRSMPGAFDATGSGTATDPYVMPGDSGSSNTNTSGGQSRGGWFGPTS